MITTNGKIFREIFNTEPFSMQFHKDWSKDVGLVHLNFTTSALVKITTKSMLYYRIKVFVVFTYYNNVNLTEFIFYFNRMIRNAWSDVRIQSKFFSKAIVLIMSNVGQVVTLNLKNGKCIQERIKSVNANKRTVLLERPFLNGKPMGEREKIFQINSIHSFRILNTEAETPNKKAISEKTIESTTTHDDAVAACAARDCPLKTTKHEETVRQVNFKKKQVEAITNACKNIAVTDTTAVRELNVHQKQQSSCSSPSDSSCPSPMVKPLHFFFGKSSLCSH
ncbi:Serine/threonine-protein kinase [Dirofilaria immitis]